MSATGQTASPGASPTCGTGEENPAFLREQIITYIGNKRTLLGFIGAGIDMAKTRLGKKKLVAADLFAGSGIVSRYLKSHASALYTNDLEAYSACINSCYLTNRSDIDFPELEQTLNLLKETIGETWKPGFITELYAPQDDENIQPGERVFYTRRNAIYLDTARQAIAELPEEKQKFFLAPLLYGASVYNNTGGIFKGFYKNSHGIGQFGGEGEHALTRIKGKIELQLPVFSAHECDVHISRLESMEAVKKLPETDVAYLDPPYNQHPYGSNYFMLNLILENKRPGKISKISGIPCNWNRSPYNSARAVRDQLFSVIRECPAKLILLSYNSEGLVPYNELMAFLHTQGKTLPLETPYNTFRASRNLRNRAIKIKEYLFLVEKK